MPGKSALIDHLALRGACFEQLFSRRVAASFGDPATEYEAVRSSAGLFDISYVGRLRVGGRDRARYLHSMLTNDIKQLRPGMGCYAALLTHQGKMESDAFVFADEEEIWLECPPAGTARVGETLRRYVVADQVEVEDHTDDFCALSIQGPDSLKIATAVAPEASGCAAPLTHCVVEGASGPWRVIRRDRSGYGGIDFWMPGADAATVWDRLVEAGQVCPCGHEALNWLRTEAGIPWFGVDMDESSLPMEFGLESALSFTKGCYRGQEIVARVTHRGRLDRRLSALAVQHREPPHRGAEVFSAGVPAGHVTSAVVSPRLGLPLALAILKNDFREPGTQLEVRIGGETRPASVVPLPLQH